MIRLIIFLFACLLVQPVWGSEIYIPTREEIAGGDVEIVAGEDRTIFEYRVNGRLMMIKVVPKTGLSYYMVPADGSAHFEDLDHRRKLYPRWVLLEW